ncbi:hypothetical protein PHYSODRAFT_261014 [Phytophthora sojae]|uniref:ZZ-type domain-containing protein n=1 Tax=Phytophthora sojae (strain P6497) TaxID=1094619 RepID=G5AA33_PHYSP|nr:hypothetical protein PHYSODRAFT_261014 [Phytophthora sojae]EGZ07462.1 hypothetical protein PHYSODRAFT_261014 [Phytophthora sojae]|eukprot:XP_009537028.1 hypothetical protein PHYSODRAFT_261014 [Phytophthora sojae]
MYHHSDQLQLPAGLLALSTAELNSDPAALETSQLASNRTSQINNQYTTKMTRTLEIKITHAEPPLTTEAPLTTEDGETLTMTKLQALAASLLPDKTDFSMRYTDSDGDQVTLTTDADVNELEKYMQSEQLQTLEVLVEPRQPPTSHRAATAVHTQLRGLVTAMSKLTAKTDANPTPTSAVNLLVASLHAMDVAEDAAELAAIKTELLLVLQDDEFRSAVQELSASEDFKELAHAMVMAIYGQDAQAIEDAATARFDELLAFAQIISLMAGLVRYNDEDVNGDDAASDSSSCSSRSSSCCSDDDDDDDDHETVDVEVFAEQVPLHMGVICNGCETAPLVGVRYKSLEVLHFNLCEDCEASGNYMRYEPFIKITDPSRAPKQKRTSDLVHPYVTCDGCEMSPIVGVRFKSDTKDDFDLCEACEAGGKWTESHGPFTKIEEPSMMRALKFTCRRGGKFGHHGTLGHHHHHGHGRRHGCDGKFGHHHDDHHHRHHGKFDEEASSTQEIRDAAARNNLATDENMEVEDTTNVQVEASGENIGAAETEGKANYSETLAQLASMGFDDVEKNIRALELANGNVGGAVNVLLSE